MNAPEKWSDAAESSAVYRELAHAFTYQGAQQQPYFIDGADYNAAFDPSVNPEACSLREGAHIDGEQSALFEELARFYEFFGLGRSEGAEMPDHISIELEFLHYLTHLEAQAPEHSLDAASICRAQRDFIDRHLSRLLGALQDAHDVQPGKCAELVSTCAAFIASELTRLEAKGRDSP